MGEDDLGTSALMWSPEISAPAESLKLSALAESPEISVALAESPDPLSPLKSKSSLSVERSEGTGIVTRIVDVLLILAKGIFIE